MDLIIVESPQYYFAELGAFDTTLRRLAEQARRDGIPVRIPEGEMVTYMAWGPPYPARYESVADLFEGCDYGPYLGENLSGLDVLVTGGLFRLERRHYRYYLAKIGEQHGIEGPELRNFSDDGMFAFVYGEVADRAFELAHDAKRVFIDGSSTCPQGELDGLHEVHAFGTFHGKVGYLIVRTSQETFLRGA